MSAEQRDFREQVAAVERWWGSPRFVRVKRPYTAEQVVSKRGTLPISYPSDAQAKKLFVLLEKHFQNGTPSHTYGA
jgi:isocitrate lyase